MGEQEALHVIYDFLTNEDRRCMCVSEEVRDALWVAREALLYIIHDRTAKSESNTLDAYLARQLEDLEFRAAFEIAQKEVREEYYRITEDYYGGEC